MRFIKMTFCLWLLFFILAGFSYAQKLKVSSEKASADSTRSVVLKSKSPMGALWRSVAFPGWG